MPSEPIPPTVISFGPFEVDLRTQELKKHGVRLRLPGQSFQILAMLLRQPGGLVPREELQQALWPADTHVDFERGVNAAVNRLRDVLGDSADNPTFIETLPRRGYRFIAPIEGLAAQEAGVAQATVEKSSISGATNSQESAPAKSHTTRNSLLATGAVLILTCAALWRSQPQPPTVTNTVRITNDGKTKNSLNPFVSDGVHLYFTEGPPMTADSGIAQVSAAGGETTWLPTTLKNVLAVSPVSPDRSGLLVSVVPPVPTDPQLWVQPLPAGAPHRIGNINALLGNWTPDGAHIVYPNGGTIMIANKDGSDPHLLAKVPGIVFGIRFSPDGRRIRFDVMDPNTQFNSLWEMDSGGRNTHPLFPEWKTYPSHCCGNWSTDGNYYYFQAGIGDNQAVWVLPERRSIFLRRAKGPARLISGPLRFSAPTPSSDGRRLFVSGEEPRVELLRYDLQARRLDSYLPGLSAGPVDFSFDKKWIAYVSYPDRTLWRIRPDGSEKMQLTFAPAEVYEPRWSPDGSQIVFMDVSSGHLPRIGLLSSTGGTPEWLTQNGADATWAPDGKSIVFGLSCDGENATIYRLDMGTRKVSSIPNSDKLCSPRLSPDGRYISALTIGGTQMKLFDTNTSEWSSLAEGSDLGFNEWSHDGKYLYMRGTYDGAREVVRVRIKDGVLERIFSLKGIPQSSSDVYTWWIGLTPDDGLLLMRDRSVQEIYALDLILH